MRLKQKLNNLSSISIYKKGLAMKAGPLPFLFRQLRCHYYICQR